MTPLELLRSLTSVPFTDATPSPIVLPDCGRKQLRAWWRLMGVKTVAEIGVWEGAFARTICAETGAFLYAIDPWAPQDGYIERKNDKARLDKALARTQAALAGYPHQIVRATSVDAARKFADRSLDVAYIDGNHLRDHVLADIAAWAPKVKPGGVLAGHDFKQYADKPFIQVFDAVTGYTAEHGLSPWFVFAADKSPSWAWVVA